MNDVIVNPQRMRSEGYGSQVACLSVCLSATTLAATAIGHGPKVRYHRILYDDFLDINSRISLRRLYSRDMALFAYHGQP